MNQKGQTRFVFSVAVILFVLAGSQLFATLTIPPLLDHADTLVGLPLRPVFYLIAGLELAVSAYLLAGVNAKVKLGFVAWLFCNLSMYQIGLQWNGSPNYLCCLGNLNDKFPVSPRIMTWVLWLLYGYCAGGSFVFMVQNWLNDRKSFRGRLEVNSKQGEPIQSA